MIKLKKSQMSGFIIIGLIIIIVTAVFLYIRFQSHEVIKDKDIIVANYAQPVKEYVDLCVKSTLENSVFTVSKQGGYFEVPPFLKVSKITNIPYYFHEVSIVPSEERITEELSKYINFNLKNCINDFAPFMDKGLFIESGEMNSKVSINPKGVSVKVDYPVTVIKDDKTQLIPSFSESMLVNMKDMYDASKNITAQISANPDYIPVTYLTNLATEKKIELKLIRLQDDSMIYLLVNNETRIMNEPYTFAFAVKYKWENNTGEI